MKMITSIAKIFAGLTPEKHTTNAYARNAQGESVEASSREAVKWCATSWIEVMYPNNASDIRQILADGNWLNLIEENDSKGYAFIKELQTMDEELDLWHPEPNE
ncbi:MAG: hypothetical protein L0287_24775 [Anaerolineae bacterium]|nr:hypothetical protein [Anaerolineae bacterium]